VTQLEKLYRRALNNPGSVRFSEVERLLLRSGFSVRQRSRGSSHYVFTRGDVDLTIPKHGTDSVKAVNVRRAMAVL